jgi:hypothetical protein
LLTQENKTIAAAKNLNIKHHYKANWTFVSWRMACCLQEKNWKRKELGANWGDPDF